MDKRPMVSTYEPDADGVEQLVYRLMDDVEFEGWQARQARAEVAANAPESEHPIITAVKSLSDAEKKELLAALGVS